MTWHCDLCIGETCSDLACRGGTQCQAALCCPPPRWTVRGCIECNIYPADGPNNLCAGCEAYREHTGAI